MRKKNSNYHSRLKTLFCTLSAAMLLISATSFAAKGGNSGKGGNPTAPPPATGSIASGASIDAACMQDIYTEAGHNGTLNCTANDIQLFQASLTVVNDDYCDFAGDTATVDLGVDAVLTAQARHDIGIYLALDGGDALHGSCNISTLPYAPDPPFVDLDGTDDGAGVQDTCGDMDADHNPISSNIGVITVHCIDVNNDGFVDLPACASWRQPGANELCTTPTDAYPGSPSKCRCEPITLDLLVQPATLQVVKTATPDIVSEPGGDVTFTVEMTNTAEFNIDATIDTITDDIYGDLTDPSNTFISNSTCAVPQILSSGETYSCSFDAPVSGNPGDEHINIVTVTGHDPEHQIGGSDQATVLINNLPSVINIDKTASPTTVSEAGGDVTFSFIITNDSAVDTVTIDVLEDSIYGDLNGQGTCSVPQVLAPGEAYPCEFSAFVTGNAGDTETNVVTTSGLDDDGSPVSATDSASVIITNIESTVQLVKTATPEVVIEPGGDVTFDFTVHNPSLVDTITITDMTDSIYGDLTAIDESDCSVPQVLPPGSDYHCQFTAYVAGNAGFTETNVATVSGSDDDGQEVSASDDATVIVTGTPSAIEIIKTATPDQITEPGGDVTFNFTINNLSDVDSVTIDTLTDTIYGDLTTLPGSTCSVTQVILPGGSYDCAFTVFVSGNPGDEHVNVATASGVDDDGQVVSDSDDATVTVNDAPSAIRLTKTASPNQVTEPGENVTFTIEIHNLSAADGVTIDTLTDSIYGNLAVHPNSSCSMPQNIAAGSSYSCTFTVLVSGVAGDTEINVATASGVDDDGQPVTASDSETVTIISGSTNTQVCDIDGDGDIDIDDLNLINDARGTTAEPNDPRDVNGDGLITINDTRACVLMCTNENCTAS